MSRATPTGRCKPPATRAEAYPHALVRRIRSRIWKAAVALLPIVSSVFAATDAVGILATAPGVAFDQELGASVPLAANFVDERGERYALAHFFDARPVVLLLGYDACPNLCGVVRRSLVHALRAVDLPPGSAYEVLAVSIDPSETPALATSTRQSTLAGAGPSGSAADWHFLTGEAGAIAALAQSVGFRYTYDPALRQYAHPAGIVILTPQGKVSRYFLGVDYNTAEIRKSLGMPPAIASDPPCRRCCSDVSITIQSREDIP